MNKVISFIQPSRNNLKYLKWSYNSIRTHLDPKHQICWADDYSDDGTWEWMNEMYQIANKCEADWEVVLDGFFRDGRVGHSHMNVPGPDGKFGFGGSCFPKDIQAIMHFGESLGLNLNTIKGAWKTNLEVRPERDWEQLKGRSVVDE